jgi:hypothetical protein
MVATPSIPPLFMPKGAEMSENEAENGGERTEEWWSEGSGRSGLG